MPRPWSTTTLVVAPWPGGRSLALEFFSKLPCYSSMPIDGRSPTLPFKRTWGLEGGLRSRLTRGLFGNVRLNYTSISDVLYGARFYPAFEVEVRP